MPSPFTGSFTNGQQITVAGTTFEYDSAATLFKNVTVGGGGSPAFTINVVQGAALPGGTIQINRATGVYDFTSGDLAITATIDGTSVTPTILDKDTIEAVIPSGASLGTGKIVEITITPTGLGAVSASDTIEITSATLYRFFWIEIIANGGDGTSVETLEFQAYSSLGGANFLTGGTGSSDKTVSAGSVANAFDNAFTTSDTGVTWNASDLPIRLGYDLGVGNGEALVEWGLAGPSGGSANDALRITEVRLYGSNDSQFSANSILLDARTGMTYTDNQITKFEAPQSNNSPAPDASFTYWWEAQNLVAQTDGAALLGALVDTQNDILMTSTNPPNYLASGVGGLAGLQFDGAANFLQSETINFNDNVVFLVANITENANNVLLEFSSNVNSNPGFILLQTTNTTSASIFKADGVTSGKNAGVNWASGTHVIAVKYGATFAELRVWRDGTELSTNNNSTGSVSVNANNNLFVMSRGGASLFSDGILAAIGFAPSSLSDTDIVNFSAALQTRYSI